MDSYEEMIIPEVPKALPNEQLFIYAPIASDDTLGVAKFDNEYFSVDADGTVHLRSVGKSGIITIPASEWTDAAPTMASVKVSGVDAGSIILMLPADEKTRLTANNAKLSAYPVAFTPVGGDSDVTIFRTEAETIPDSDMTFTYLVLKTGITGKSTVAAIVGVDAYGEGGGGSGGGGSVDPEIVNQVLVAASAAQTSAENAATSAEAANSAKSAAETAAERAESAAERAESAGGAGGGGESEYTGSFVIDWRDSRLGMGNTNGDYFTNGAQIDVYPANERTYRLASEIGLYVYMVADHTTNDVIIFGLNDDAEMPDETMTFNFNVTDMGTDDIPVAILHTEWSGSGGGSADEATIDAKIYEHNTANDSHQDIRLMIKEHEEAVNALLNSDDETLNETKEIVAYIKSNKSLIDAITTSKVNVSDIINNLTTNVTNKPLSAAQGVALKALIDGLQSGKLNATDLTSAINTALAQAKASGEFDGKDGKSAYELAQENGYKGSLADFFTDMKGEDGKSAYAYAKDGGYGGTEEEFAEDIDPDNIANIATNNAKGYITGDLKGDIVSEIIAQLQGLPVFGVVDENNIITVTSQLSGGTYTLKYENADGTLVYVGTITIEGKVVIVNLLESALTPNDITTVFDGVGYKNGYYASAAEPFYNTDAAFFCSGLMPIPEGRTFYIKGCTFDTSLSHTRFGAMSKTGLLVNTAKLSDWGNNIAVTELGKQYYSILLSEAFMGITSTNGDYPYYFYFSASGTGDNVIVSATPME